MHIAQKMRGLKNAVNLSGVQMTFNTERGNIESYSIYNKFRCNIYYEQKRPLGRTIKRTRMNHSYKHRHLATDEYSG